MTLDILYNIFIMPLELVFQIIFWFLQELPGIAIILISLVMNFLALPLYKRADAIHEEDRKKNAEMSLWTGHIKKTFRGDERYLMLQTYYRQQHYKPVYGLRSSISLLLQIPFFIAAYHFLSNCTALNGRSFLFLQDLSAPDQLLSIGSLTVNLMPVVMTLINVISAFIYLRGCSLRDKLQTYAIAAIFLVLLYNSPSGLVFYWTLNQIFSVFKNIVMKLIAPKLRKKKAPAKGQESANMRPSLFFMGAFLMTVLTGLLIPLSVIQSSPDEFITAASDPAVLVLQNFCICLGLFVIWLGVYYLMGGAVVRRVFTYGIFLLCGLSLLDYMAFAYDLGSMSSYLVFGSQPYFSSSQKLINLLAVLLLCALLFLVLRFLPKVVPYVYTILLIGCLALSGWYAVSTAQQAERARESLNRSAEVSYDKILPLSKEGHNVVIFMLDRAISGYVPYIFQEKPELQEQFAGFTYYPNTVSFGSHTNYSAPSLYGGYEYTPAAINARDDLSVPEEHNEAIRMLPKLFSDAGYQVTVCDPLYAGYRRFVPDLSVFDDIPNVDARITYGAYGASLLSRFESAIKLTQKRNFFFYSMFRIVPTALKNAVYNNGNYYYTATKGGLACSEEFLYAYAVLYNLPALTDIREDASDHLFILNNNTTHAPAILQTPEYEPSTTVTGDPFADPERFVLNGREVKMQTREHIAHYHVNMAALLQIGKWLDYLRAEGVYDNTRILILSDHGNGLGQFEDLLVREDWDAQWVNSLLLYKDFGCNDYTVSEAFMTAADMPALAVRDLIEDPRNPFTGYDLLQEINKEEQMITSAHNWNIDTNRGLHFDVAGGSWWKIHGNVHDPSAWERVE